MRSGPRLIAAAALSLAAWAMPLAALPQDARTHVERAEKALARRDGLGAEIELKAALASGAARPDVAADFGEAYLYLDNPVAARAWLGPGQFARGSESRGFLLLGRLERMQGNLPAAGRAFDRALAFTPRDPLLWVEIGRLRFAGGEQLQAFEAADKALQFGPDNARALEFKAQLVGEAQGWNAAIELYEQALAANPDDVGVLAGYAAALGEAGRAREMLKATRHLLTLAPGEPRGWFLLATLAARAGNVDLARAMLNRAGKRLADEPAAMLLAGTLELEAGNANNAAQLLGPLVERQPANPRAQLLFARALYEIGDYKALLDRFSRLAQRPDAPAYLLTIMGRAYEEIGDRAAAGELLDRAAAIGPAPIMAVFEPEGAAAYAAGWSASQGSLVQAVPYVRSLIAAGDSAAAVTVANRFLELHPGSGDALGLAGDAQLAAGNAAGALPLYQAAARVRFPERMLVRIGESSDRLGLGAAMPELVARYLERFPQSTLAVRMAATMAASEGDWPTVRLLLENLRQRGGNRDVRLLADLSFAQLRSGNAQAALESATRAWQLQPASAAAAQARGMALAELGRDPALARQLLEQARRSGGDNALLKAARAKLK